MSDPILRRKHLSKATAERDYGRKVPLTIVAEGGLHYIRGNSSPHFSLTIDIHRKGFPEQSYGGGCDHETIVKHWPELADLAALHLSDIDGQPMHAESNGWYWLEGAAGLRNPNRFGAGLKEETPEVCLPIFARHCRISEAEAQTIVAKVQCEASLDRDAAVAAVAPSERTLIAAQLAESTPRKTWAAICARMVERWKAEAEACIVKHGLRLYGDPWEGMAAWRAAHPAKGEPASPANVEPEADGLAELVKSRGLVFTIEPDQNRADIPEGMPKDSRHFRYSIKRGSLELKGGYSVGPGIVESWLREAKPFLPGYQDERRAFLKGERTVYAERYTSKAGENYRPELRDVLQSLASDAQTIEAAPLFEDWCSELGYDPDSRKAESIWKECTTIRHKLAQLLGADEFAALTE